MDKEEGSMVKIGFPISKEFQKSNICGISGCEREKWKGKVCDIHYLLMNNESIKYRPTWKIEASVLFVDIIPFKK